jgi:hypothetical protein
MKTQHATIWNGILSNRIAISETRQKEQAIRFAKKAFFIAVICLSIILNLSLN